VSVSVDGYIIVSAILFFTGVIGVIVRRNPLIQLMSIELLFNAANLALVTFARAWLSNTGHIFAFLVITVAAAEAAIGLAIVAIVFRQTKYVDVDEVMTLKG
jgi:NADH-quinone oxidoreductase subunit K